MSKYEVIEGRFPCHTCREECTSLRFYKETKDLTWMCRQKHISMVSLLSVKKTKKDYEREG